MKELPGFGPLAKITMVKKGWSSDQKYQVETPAGEKLLLRCADKSLCARKQFEFEMMEQAAALGIPMSRPVAFGVCREEEQIYSLFTWCEGEEGEVVLPLLTNEQQYQLGVRAGELLKQLHSIPAPENRRTWSQRFNRKASSKIEQYRSCGIRFEGDEQMIAYLEAHRSLFENRPETFQHGDYHVGNMIISSDLQLSIIDFNRMDSGDPWEEFNRIVWSAAISLYFASGQINGYFNDQPPEAFFRLLACYIASNTLSSLPWAIPFGKAEVMNMKEQAEMILSWYDQMKRFIPNWYLQPDGKAL